MASLNKVMVIARLGRDPETNYTPSGVCVCKFSAATTEYYQDKQGQRQERTEWHKCVAWGKLGEVAGKYLAKGSQFYGEGRLQTQEWEKDGIKRYTTEVVLNVIQFLDAKPKQDQPGNTGYDRGGYQKPKPQYSNNPENSGYNDGGFNYEPPSDDIPF